MPGPYRKSTYPIRSHTWFNLDFHCFLIKLTDRRPAHSRSASRPMTTYLPQHSKINYNISVVVVFFIRHIKVCCVLQIEISILIHHQKLTKKIVSFLLCMYDGRSTFNYSVPELSWLAAFLLLMACLVLHFVPMRVLLLLWGIVKFSRRLIRPHSVPNNEVLDLLSRVPNDEELVSNTHSGDYNSLNCDIYLVTY